MNGNASTETRTDAAQTEKNSTVFGERERLVVNVIFLLFIASGIGLFAVLALYFMSYYRV